ncbi:MAG TPA: bifunctional phosphoglucose/phosphomannose isomerase [Candidatus Caldiarchaeum subterraneum]|uniref:Bifunctional phosphoglucose/phosphomannose isomerase n=1 Tax=Caldiarchaeum subterraneum TaxID=311458 RepID=A0A832ZUI2_CALS0|nr:bifunctional phosphoglucose/phosphomannose isomerase [Aigarchaeota archaeon]HIQ29215.1 bifunctional phosphoglucose/phosphomannose isomerase [Candidatus Caldarchaeum subterraneum]
MNEVEQAWEYVKQSPELYSRGFERGREVGENIDVKQGLQGVLFLGMGGSGIAGDITQDLLPKPYKTPIHVIKDYAIPFKLDERFLVIAVSYSGTTAETITAAAQARRQGAKLVFITSGGDMMEIAEKNGIPVVEVTKGLQPRFATPEMVGASYGLLTSTGLTEDNKFPRYIEELRSFVSGFKSTDSGEPAEAAEAMAGKPIVIYSHSHLVSSGYRFKAQLNENAKHPAFHSILPEAGHNEVEAWPANPNVTSVILRSGWEKPALRELISWMLEELERRRMNHHQLRVAASSPTSEILKLIALIDFISVALARKNNVNPTRLEILPQVRRAVKTNEKLKEHAVAGF